MSVRKILGTLAVASMLAAPTLAQAAPAAGKLSVSSATARAGAPVARSNRQDGGGSGGIIIAVLAAAAVIAGIVIAADGNDNPTSA